MNLFHTSERKLNVVVHRTRSVILGLRYIKRSSNFHYLFLFDSLIFCFAEAVIYLLVSCILSLLVYTLCDASVDIQSENHCLSLQNQVDKQH